MNGSTFEVINGVLQLNAQLAVAGQAEVQDIATGQMLTVERTADGSIIEARQPTLQ